MNHTGRGLPRRPVRLGVAPVVLAAVLGATGLAGCDSGDAPRAADPTGSPTGSPSGSPVASSTPSASVTAGASPSATGSPSAPATGPTSTADLLLSARALPGLDAAWRWSVRISTVDPTVVGICSRVPMQTLGADDVVTRVFVPTGDDGGATARQVVARFVDDRSADQAMSVLAAFRTTCARRLATGSVAVDVSPATSVRVAEGQASWFVTRTAAPGSPGRRTNALGVLRSGTTVELLELDATGAGLVDPAGGAADEAPISTALKRAARLLG